MTINKRGLENEIKGKIKETEGKFRGDLGKATGDTSEHVKGRFSKSTFLSNAMALLAFDFKARLPRNGGFMRVLRVPFFVLPVLASVGCNAADTPVGPVALNPRTSRGVSAQRMGPRVVNIRPEGVEDYYITVRPEVNHELVADSLAKLVNGKLGYVYKNFHAFTIFGISTAGLDALAKLPAVVSIQKGSFGTLASSQALPTNDALWHLDQIDQLGGPRNFTFNYFYPGNGVHIYFLDSGIDTSSGELAGRIGQGAAYTQTPGALPYQPTISHGTMTAALAAGTTYGVAKSAIVHAVRITGSDKTFRDTDLNSGVDWIISNAATFAGSGIVVNSSLTSNSSLSQAAYQRLSSHDISVVKAAGNANLDACSMDVSNTNVQYMIVVGAIDRTNTRWYSSAYGPCVGVFAPGVNVQSMGLGGVPETASGTSMATPVVAGEAASALGDFISHYGLPGYPAAVPYYAVTESVLKDSVINPGTGSPNKRIDSLHPYFLFNGPNGIYSDAVNTTYYTWSMASPFGGDGTWSNYVWQVSTTPPYTAFTVVGTGPTYTRAIRPRSSESFQLRLTASSFGHPFTQVLAVQVFAPPNCQPIACPQ